MLIEKEKKMSDLIAVAKVAGIWLAIQAVWFGVGVLAINAGHLQSVNSVLAFGIFPYLVVFALLVKDTFFNANNR